MAEDLPSVRPLAGTIHFWIKCPAGWGFLGGGAFVLSRTGFFWLLPGHRVDVALAKKDARGGEGMGL